jgi:hypothetical protein
MYFTKHPGDEGMKRLKGAHIVSVKSLEFKAAEKRNEVREQLPYDKIVVYNPCATEMLTTNPNGPITQRPKYFGCAQSIEAFGLKGVLLDRGVSMEKNFETFELKSGEGGFSVEQVPITCGNPENQAKRALAFGA